MDSTFITVCDKGTYFYPAYNHYGRTTRVRCDRCGKEDLNECIGYGDRLDLCLSCVTIINAQRFKKEPRCVTRMMQDQYFREPIQTIDDACTYMEQNQFSTKPSFGEIRTLMEQNEFSYQQFEPMLTMMEQNQLKLQLKQKQTEDFHRPTNSGASLKWQGKELLQEKPKDLTKLL